MVSDTVSAPDRIRPYHARLMSGIVGMVGFGNGSSEGAREGAVREMLRAVAHRGPEGQRVTVHGRCVMGLARLSILDRASGERAMHLPGDPAPPPPPPRPEAAMGHSPGGMRGVTGVREAAQPQAGTLGSLHLVFNGEIYNHRYLRSILQRRGHVFRTDHSDAEVLLVGYREWGDALPKHLQGMFAFAIWDEGENSLLLCRDRFGKKPLFVRRDEGGVAFASLAGALGLPDASTQTPQRRRAGEGGGEGGEGGEGGGEGLRMYLRLGYPLRKSMVQGVEELEPAHWLRFGSEGATGAEVVSGGRYWRPPPVSRHSSSLGAADALEEVVREAVAARLEADVDLNVMLTGDIGSTLIGALAAQWLRAGGQTLQTFSVAGGMNFAASPPPGDPERVAGALATHHAVLELPEMEDGERAVSDLERLVELAGEPLADPRALLWFRAYSSRSESGRRWC